MKYIRAITTCLAPALVLFFLIVKPKIGLCLLAIWIVGLYLELHDRMEHSYLQDYE